MRASSFLPVSSSFLFPPCVHLVVCSFFRAGFILIISYLSSFHEVTEGQGEA